MRRFLSALTLGVTLAGSSLPAGARTPDRSVPPDEFMRGVVISCPRAGQIWGSPQMAESLRTLGGLGVEWVAIHPYAGVRRNGTVRQRWTADTDYLARANELIRAEGLKLFWKPHLAYWGSFRWRGDIEFADEADWERFFTGYREFILDQARFAESVGAEIFALGVELDRTVHRDEWPALIEAVRDVYSGKITYAANWDQLGAVPFWSQLDLIGVHAYFPLSTDPEPQRAALASAWEEVFDGLGDLSRRLGDKPLFFAEIGYSRSPTAAAEPWSPDMVDSPAVKRLRQRLIEVAIEQVERDPLVSGMFWWKWIPGPVGHDRDFSMKDSEARRALRRYWGPQSNRAGMEPRPYVVRGDPL